MSSPSSPVVPPARTAPQRHWRSARLACLLVALGCGGADSTRPATADGSGPELTLTLTLPTLDPLRDGRYEAWAVTSAGTHVSLARFPAGGVVRVASPPAAVDAIEITLEPPDDHDAAPSEQVVLHGPLVAGHAVLTYVGAITQGDLPMRSAPGQFTMFTPSDNDSLGYPSNEQSGVWLFNMSPAATAQRDYYVRLAQLQRGWIYEGWMVRDMGQPGEIWLSYGKFLPDWTGAVNQPDDTGWGPFSGVTDFRRARLEDFPGDDWIANPLRLPWRPELPLPLDLREKDATGAVRWSHVISIEPASDLGEPITTERPSVLRPYVDTFGDAGPGIARSLTLRAERMPAGTADRR